MKHIKLFESFSSQPSALIVANGDWSGIMKNPKDSTSWINPSTYYVTYYSNPSQSELSMNQGYVITDLSDIVSDIFGGDQNGGNLENGDLKMLVDRNISTRDIQASLQEYINKINLDPRMSGEEDMAQTILEEPNAREIYTPEYLAHCRQILQGENTRNLMQRALVFKVL